MPDPTKPPRRFPPPWTVEETAPCFIVRDAMGQPLAYYEDDRGMAWRTQMTEPITDENFYNEHAALLGHVALAWNDCHSVVLSIFHTLSGVSWQNASSIFLALKSDHDRRETTLSLMDQVLTTDNDRTIRDWGTQLLGQLGNLGYEGTVATHTMWVTVMRQRKTSPHPDLPKPPKHLKEDFKSQFSKLTTNLRDLFRELLLHHSALRVHLEQRKQPATTEQ
jgi:hypothetical protein